jgi:hypothetical protein
MRLRLSRFAICRLPCVCSLLLLIPSQDRHACYSLNNLISCRASRCSVKMLPRVHKPIIAYQLSKPALHSASYDRFPSGHLVRFSSTMTNRISLEVMSGGWSMLRFAAPCCRVCINANNLFVKCQCWHIGLTSEFEICLSSSVQIQHLPCGGKQCDPFVLASSRHVPNIKYSFADRCCCDDPVRCMRRACEGDGGVARVPAVVAGFRAGVYRTDMMG